MGEKQKQGKTKKRSYWIYFFAALAVLLVVVYFIPYVTGALKLTYTATYGDVQIDDEAKVYIARDEKVYVANQAGKINKLIKQGQLVKKDTAIVGVEANGATDGDKESKYKNVLDKLGGSVVKTEDYHSKAPGIASYYIDGLESTFTEKNIANLTEEDVKEVDNKNIMELDRETTMAGEPLFKIVNNAKWFAFTWLPTEDATKYKKGETVHIKFEDATVDADVNQVVEQDDKTLIILKSNRYYEVFDQKRCAEVTLIASNTAGIVLEKDSIVEEDGQKGVYVKNTLGDFVFKPINILAEDGDKVVVAKSFYYDSKGKRIETVNTYDQVQR